MTIDDFLSALQQTPERVEFADTMAVIEANYHFTPTRWHNGALVNEAEQNQGSCKLLGFARRQQLTPQQTLHCFGRYYREDVLGHPAGTDHQNIRNFMQSGWEGVEFESEPLSPRAL